MNISNNNFTYSFIPDTLPDQQILIGNINQVMFNGNNVHNSIGIPVLKVWG